MAVVYGHPHNAGTEHVGFSTIRQTSRAPRCEWGGGLGDRGECGECGRRGSGLREEALGVGWRGGVEGGAEEGGSGIGGGEGGGGQSCQCGYPLNP